MKDIIIKLLFTALAIAAVVFFILSSDGIQGDTKSIKDKSSNAIESRLQP